MSTGPRSRTDDELRAHLRSRVIEDEAGCWVWQGALGVDGYGRAGHRRAHWLVHRLTYTMFVGPIPEGLEVDHLCRVKACVNPAHLEPVTPLENTRRAWPFIDWAARRKTHCSKGHEWTPEITRLDPKGSRHCTLCDRLARDARTARRKAARIARDGMDLGPYSRRHIHQTVA